MANMIRNNTGFALLTSLMFTLIAVTIIMAVLYVITQGIQTSGQSKRYHTALEASYGGSEIVVKDILPVIMQNFNNGTFASAVTNSFPEINLQLLSDQNCLQSKLSKSTADWPTGCSNTSSVKSSPDMSMVLQAQTGSPFKVYTKIVDTIQGNTDGSGFELEGSGVAESSPLIRPQQIPYIYRLEIQGERQNNPTAQANIEVLYAY